jgi:hypothetical protein
MAADVHFSQAIQRTADYWAYSTSILEETENGLAVMQTEQLRVAYAFRLFLLVTNMYLIIVISSNSAVNSTVYRFHSA